MRRSILSSFALVLSCGGAPEPETPGTQACKTPPELGRVYGISPGTPPPRAPMSHVGATLHIPNALFEQTLASSVPEVVAEGRNVSAGAAGRTTFKIKRGEPRVKTSNAGLALSVKLDGEIHLCKPFGGVCIAYGSCRPEWTAEVFMRSPWRLRDEPDVSLNVEISKGCVLSPVKVDVTSELEKVTDAEVAKLRKQLQKQVRRFHRSLQKQLAHPAPLGSQGECLTFAPNELELAVDVDDRGYTLNVEATGTPAWGCDAPTPVHERARVVTRERLSPKTDLHVTTEVPLLALTTEWQTRVPSQQIRVSPRERDLLVEVAGWRGCASGWVVYRPTYDGTLTLEATDTSDPTLPSLLGTPRVLSQTSVTHRARVLQLMQSVGQPLTLESELLAHPLRVEPAPSLNASDHVRVSAATLKLETTLEGTISAKLHQRR